MRFAERTAWDRSATAFAEIVANARAERRDLLDLTESNPTRVGLGPGPELIALLGDPKGAAYRPDPRGSRTAREAVRGYYADRGFEIAVDDILLSASSSEAYAWIFRLLCDPGDEVLVPAPSYPLFGWLADLADVTLRPYPLSDEEGFRPDLAAIERGLGPRTRAVVAVHPNNPTGTMWRDDDAAAIDALLARREAALLVDEVFADYVDPGRGVGRPASFAGPRSALTFVLSGLSKVLLAPQLKLGWTVVGGPAATVKEALDRLEVIADTFLSVATPIQIALPALLAARAGVQRPLQARIADNLAALDAALASAGADRIVRRRERDGGWSVVLEVPRTRTEDEWVERLAREDGLVVHPGHFFEMPRRGFLVIGLLAEPVTFADAARRLVARLHAC